MVDFNNETTITQNAGLINRISVLERRYYIIEALKTYYKLTFQKASCQENVIRAGILCLFFEIRETLKRKLEEAEFLQLESDIKRGEGDFLLHIEKLNFVLDKIGLIKLDNKRDYDRTDVEAENNYFGL